MSNDTLASGGKTWSFPTNTATTAATKSKNNDIIFQDFLFHGLLGLIFSMGIMGFFLMFLRVTDWNILNVIAPSLTTDSTVSSTEGYSTTSAPTSLFVIVIALILFAANKVIFGLRLWHNKKIRITLIALFVFSTFGAASVAEASMSFNESETTSTKWMQERYDFSADNPELSSVLTDGEYLYDSKTKTIAKVQKEDNKFYLYSPDGKELPLK